MISRWKVGADGHVPDVLLIAAADQADAAAQAVTRALASDGAAGLHEIYRETGSIRSDAPGHEHFGFKDGIAQPAVRGVASATPGDFLTPRLIAPADPLSAMFSQPGRPLVMPGHFVLGYDCQSKIDGSVVPAAALPAPWLRNGSFLVFAA